MKDAATLFSRFLWVLTLSFLVVATGCESDDDGNGGLLPAGNNIKPVDFLSGKQYDALLVELQYMPGMRPNAESRDNLKEFLSTLLHKPGGIVFMEKEIPSGNRDNYSLDQIRNLEDEHREFAPGDDELASYMIFLDAPFSGNSGDSNVLGVAYRPTSTAFFESTIQSFSGGPFQPSETTLETTVMNHEFGHLLGLVNNGTPMTTDHQDEVHGAHCDVEDCLMYFSAETSDNLANLMGGQIPVLDSQCRDDLKANGGK